MVIRKQIKFHVGGVCVCETDMYRAFFKCVKRTEHFVWLEPSAMWKRHMRRQEPLKLKCKWETVGDFNSVDYDEEYVQYKDGHLFFRANETTKEENFNA